MGKIRTRRSGRLGAWLAAIFGLVFFAVGVGATGSVWHTWFRYRAAQGWEEVQAILVDVRLDRHDSSDGGPTYSVKCAYRYRYAGQEYTATRVGLHGGSDNVGSWQQRTFQRLDAAHRAEQPVLAFVNPSDPSQALLDRNLRSEMLVFTTGFAVIFGSIGIGVLVASLVSLTKGAVSADSQQRRLASADRTEAVIWPKERGRPVIGWAVVVYWHLTELPLIIHLPSMLSYDSGWATYLGTLYPAVGGAILVWAVRATLAARRWSGSYLELHTLPGVIGGPFSADLVLTGQIPAMERVIVTLRCIETVADRHGGESHLERRSIWETVCALHDLTPAFGQESVRLPVRFQIPFTCKPTIDDEGAGNVTWELVAESPPSDGDLRLTFEVPVYRTAESNPELTEDRTEAIQQVVEGQVEPAPPPATILVEQDTAGVETFVIRRWPGWSFFGMFMGIGVLFVCVGVALALNAMSSIDWFDLFQCVLGLFLALGGCVFAAVSLFTLGVDRITIGQGWLVARSSLLSVERTWKVDLADVSSVSIKESGKSYGSSRVAEVWYALHAELINRRKPRRLAAMIRGRSAADWLKTRIESHLQGERGGPSIAKRWVGSR